MSNPKFGQNMSVSISSIFCCGCFPYFTHRDLAIVQNVRFSLNYVIFWHFSGLQQLQPSTELMNLSVLTSLTLFLNSPTVFKSLFVTTVSPVPCWPLGLIGLLCRSVNCNDLQAPRGQHCIQRNAAEVAVNNLNERWCWYFVGVCQLSSRILTVNCDIWYW